MPFWTHFRPHERSGWRPGRVCRLLLALALAAASPATFAITRIVIEVGEIALPQVHAGGVSATLDLTPPAGPSATARVAQLDLPAPIGALRDVALNCSSVVIREPSFACRGGRMAAQGSPIRTISMQVSGEYNSANGAAALNGSGLAVGGGVAELSGRLDSKGWSIEANATALDVKQVRALAAPWFKVPDSLSFEGHVDAQAQAVSRSGAVALNADLRTADLNLTNAQSTVVAEKVATGLRLAAERTSTGYDVEARLEGSSGQALAGPVLLDFGANPLTLETRGRLAGETLTLDALSLVQRNLSEVHGQAVLALGRAPYIAQAHLDIASLLFPAAYTSFMQIGLAATDFGQLKTTGIARGSLDLASNSVTRAQLRVRDLSMQDAKNTFAMSDVDASLDWSADPHASVAPSSVSWSRASAYGLSGGAARVDFVTRGLGFELTKPTRLPVFDGAVVVNKMTTAKLGAADAELSFDAVIEPISLSRLCRAFGWPDMSGQLAGTIPGLKYRNRVLSVDGDLVASVFDGTIIGRGFRLQDPGGPWPRLFADVTARRLDLSLVTRTFAIGSITGRLDADIQNLELFNWSPVGFDARLYSTPGDKSRKIISQKAVTSLSNVGGGGGGVTATLESGVLRFFDDFRYEAIGLACKLENDVCLMSGVEPAGVGYYIVRGKGLPRIDIIGNQGRVAWPQLVSQIVAGMHGSAVVR